SSCVDGFRAPTSRHTHREERLRFRGEIQRAVVFSVEERLDAESVASGNQALIALVPYDKRILASQVVQTFRTVVFVQMQRDLAVGFRAELMAACLELAANSLEVVEL